MHLSSASLHLSGLLAGVSILLQALQLHRTHLPVKGALAADLVDVWSQGMRQVFKLWGWHRYALGS